MLGLAHGGARSIQGTTSMIQDLATAAERQQLSVLYQPIFNSKTRAVTAFEALLRWEHPVWGAISPADFVAWAEASDLILALGDWVIETVCRQIAAWSARGLALPRVCVNVSAKQFEDRAFARRVLRCLSTFDIDASQIELELTETVAFHDFDAAAATMVKLRAAGIALSVDDFGAGCTSMHLASELPMTTLKIDRCLTQAVEHDARRQAIVACIVSMSRALGMRTIAEGVDSCESARVLESIGCDELQGFYLSPPLHAASVPKACHDRLFFERNRHVAQRALSYAHLPSETPQDLLAYIPLL
jgi:EAL domain-containing protein (putative c-di-GMP-specific phosphodiesterase class I)